MSVLPWGAMNGIESAGEGNLLTGEGKGKIVLINRELLSFRIGIYPAFLGDKDREGAVFVFVQALHHGGSTLEGDIGFSGVTSHKYSDIFHLIFY